MTDRAFETLSDEGRVRATSGVALTVNGQHVSAEVEPRLQLADFLREHLLLTGTHLGCEHGVCGACTIEIDGAPARSCITYAVACSGAHVRTIEGFDGDPLMAELREAFSAEHALQCGYCTPGMLMTARDIVLRLPDADEPRVRKELAGNLCRCTGYVGIVRAILRVLAARRERGEGHATEAREHESPPGAVSVAPIAATAHAPRAPIALPAIQAQETSGETGTGGAAATSKPAAGARPANTLHESFVVAHPREKVWAYFERLEDVTSCLPGASVIDMPAPDRAEVMLRVKLGPIAAEFSGAARVERDPSSYSGTIHGSARDARSSSSTRGTIRYALAEEGDGAATRVDLDVEYALTGTLAQFGRSGIVRDIARRMTAAFARNLEGRLNEQVNGRSTEHTKPAPELNAGALLFSAIWSRVKAFFGSFMRR